MKRVFVKGKLPSCKFALREFLPEIALFTLSFVRSLNHSRIPSFFYFSPVDVYMANLSCGWSVYGTKLRKHDLHVVVQIRILKWAACCFFLIVKACSCSSSNKQLQTRSCAELDWELIMKFKIVCGEAKSKQEEGLQYAPKLVGLAIMPLVELAARLQGTMKAWSVFKQLLMLHKLGILLWKKNVDLIWSSRHQICYSKQMAWLLHSLLQICGCNVQKHSMIYIQAIAYAKQPEVLEKTYDAILIISTLVSSKQIT